MIHVHATCFRVKKNSALQPANVFISFVEQTVIISLNNFGKRGEP